MIVKSNILHTVQFLVSVTGHSIIFLSNADPILDNSNCSILKSRKPINNINKKGCRSLFLQRRSCGNEGYYYPERKSLPTANKKLRAEPISQTVSSKSDFVADYISISI